MSRQALDEAKRLRARDDVLLDELRRRDQASPVGSPSLIGQTKTVQAYPAAAQSFYACVPQTVLGKEKEGGTGILTPGTATFFALNLGTAVPPVGTSILATFVESRWVFRYDG